MVINTYTVLHEISFRSKLNVFNLVSGQSLTNANMKYPKIKLIAGVLLLWSSWQKWNCISADKMLCKHYSQMKHTHANIKETC